MSGALLALSAAAILGLNTAIVRRSVLRASAYDGIVISIVLAVPIFAALALATGQLSRVGEFTGWQHLALAVAGIMNFLGGASASSWRFRRLARTSRPRCACSRPCSARY